MLDFVVCVDVFEVRAWLVLDLMACVVVFKVDTALLPDFFKCAEVKALEIDGVLSLVVKVDDVDVVHGSFLFPFVMWRYGKSGSVGEAVT